MKIIKVAIAGTVGLPAKYGGFETLTENLVSHHDGRNLAYSITVYCSRKHYRSPTKNFGSAALHYFNLNANGGQSILYDAASIFHAATILKCEVILLLGVSGAIFIPLVKCFSRAKIITNIDGIEWRRDKWNKFARWFLRFSERVAVKFSDSLITDNEAIFDYVMAQYQVNSKVIAYGGDHAVSVDASADYTLPTTEDYALTICRIEPENNIESILVAASKQAALHFIIVGNWSNSNYGQALKSKYSSFDHIHLLDPIYSTPILKTLRTRAALYVHGHSAGGTNPSLVEAMHFALPIIAFDCSFNRNTTENQARYFSDSDSLVSLLNNISASELHEVGNCMSKIAATKYTWETIAGAYWDLISSLGRRA